MGHYRDFISPAIADHLLASARPVPGVQGLVHVGEQGGLETTEALNLLVELYQRVRGDLDLVLEQRRADREFIDRRTRALYRSKPDQDVLGLEDHTGRIVVGPLHPGYWKTEGQKPIAPLPEYLRGTHVTLFGPPDDAKMCINAMNAYHRQIKGEPEIVGRLLKTQTSVPKWGADDEDSKTPIRADLVSAGENLSRCFTGELSFIDEQSGRRYELQKEKLSLPIKRFPGLALPCSFLFHEREPLPLHLYDFFLHFFRNWNDPRALVFYVPKLENEEEARYIHTMIATAEELIQSVHPSYKKGTIRLMIVLENPRAVFRTHEIIDALHPYFAGASLGWHDFLASTARLFKEDGNYRIPVKSDPDIVIKYIKASHELLARVVGPRGGIKVGGMYGILPLVNDLRSESFQVTLKGYFRDVVTQMKRELDGFWVAHPDFVRLGLALVEAWRLRQAGDAKPLEELVRGLLEPKYQREILDFIEASDIESLDANDPRYARALIVADLKGSTVLPNNHPDEVRYNVFQALQYLADWLCGNGCVALPTDIGGVAVRVMDDLATAERSRWEVWHEIHHGRFKLEDFLRIAHEELRFIRKDLSDEKKIVQVKWNEKTAKWYPVALKLMIKLMTDSAPVEFATELLMPFTMSEFREADDPWAKLASVDSEKYRLDPYTERFNHYFEICGHQGWASAMAQAPWVDHKRAESLIMGFELTDLVDAASFHGNIGEAKTTLDARATREQALVFAEAETMRSELLELGKKYRDKFGVKFLISAQGKSGRELLAALKERYGNTQAQELDNARKALWEITKKRLGGTNWVEELRAKHGVSSAQIALVDRSGEISALSLNTTNETLFEVASLSKTVASAFAIEYFKARAIPLSTSVNSLFAKTKSSFRIRSEAGCPAEWGDQVTLAHLMSHGALNMHYVFGVPADREMPPIESFLDGISTYRYPPVRVINAPGTKFQYSGGGFLVLEHLIEALEGGAKVRDLTRGFLDKLGLRDFTFDQSTLPGRAYATGIRDDGSVVEGTRMMFPAFAAGAMSTARAMLSFLKRLGEIHRDTALEMFHASDKGSIEFMGAKMGLGVFVAEAGPNRLAIHQGANDGFRCLYLYCFSGPNAGQGMVLLCNAELRGVRFIADAAKRLLVELGFEGVQLEKFRDAFDPSNIKSEEVVNRGYKDLIFSAFEPRRAAAIPRRGPLDPLFSYNRAISATVVSITDDIFARAENLIDPHLPVFEPDLYCPEGKVMDSWESARHSPRGREELVLKLVRPTQVRFITLSTAFHNGNHVPAVSIEGLAGDRWREILPKVSLDGHALKHIRVEQHLGTEFRQIKIVTHPDGGLTRLALYDDALPAAEQARFVPAAQAKSEPYPEPIPAAHKPLVIPFNAPPIEPTPGQEFNNASAAYGAKILSCSNEHYGPASQVISPIEPLHMFDGFESARSRTPGHFEQFTLQLAMPRPVHRIEFDFTYFVNNNPRAVRVEGLAGKEWIELVPLADVKAFAGNTKCFQIREAHPLSQLRVFVHPDGGINRVKAYSMK